MKMLRVFLSSLVVFFLMFSVSNGQSLSDLSGEDIIGVMLTFGDKCPQNAPNGDAWAPLKSDAKCGSTDRCDFPSQWCAFKMGADGNPDMNSLSCQALSDSCKQSFKEIAAPPTSASPDAATTPAAGGSTPAAEATTPAAEGSTPPPADGSTPAAETTAPPDAGGSTAAPAEGGSTPAPADGGTTPAPAEGGSTPAAAEGGTSAAPEGGSTPAAGEGGSTAPPEGGEGATTPAAAAAEGSTPSDISAGGSSPPSSSPSTPADCCDYHEYCCFWASVGQCESNKDFMGPICQKSCGTCGCDMDAAKCATPKVADACKASSGTPINSGDACNCKTSQLVYKDWDGKCPSYAANGGCASNTSYMKAMCKFSCHVCQ